MAFAFEEVRQSERDAAYNNAAAVLESTALLSRLDWESAALRARSAETMDIPFGPRERQRLDIFPGRPEAPCLVYFHGGYWQSNRREMFSVLKEGIAAHGWSVVMAGYTLAPDASLSAIVEEVAAAIDFIEAHRKTYAMGGPLIVTGSSAGATLAALALEHPAVSGGLALSGIFELAPLRDTYLNAKLQLTDREVSRLSPMRRHIVGKPFAIAIGGDELPAIRANAFAYHALLAGADGRSPLIDIAGVNHFSILEELRRPDSSPVQALLDIANRAERTK